LPFSGPGRRGYLSYLIKRRAPRGHRHRTDRPAQRFRRSVFDRALHFCADDDRREPTIVAYGSMNDIALVLRGERIVIDSVNCRHRRLKFLQLLQARALGQWRVCRRAVKAPEAVSRLVVGADGVNSLVRRTHAQEFGASLDYLTNRFAWFGTTKRFETLTQTFIKTELGSFNAHHYRFTPD
jgi:hypothetical protein